MPLSKNQLEPTNPFSSPSILPYGLPDFAAIRDEHYLPAARAGMVAEVAEIAAIIANPEPPTVENTLEALERSGDLLGRTLSVLYNVASSDSSAVLEDIEEELVPELSAHHDSIFMDAALYARVALLDAAARAGQVSLTPDSAWLLTNLLLDFRRSGINLSETDQETLRDLNARITSLEAAFGRKLLAGANAASVLVTDKADLEGLPDDAVAAAAQAAADRGEQGKYLLEMQLPTQQGVLASLRRRGVRQRVHEASVTRGATGDDTDTRETVLELVKLRAEHATLLGYAHHGAYIAEDATAKTTEAINAMLAPLAPAAAANAAAEAADLQEALVADVGDPSAVLEAWDWAYYAERVRKDRYSLDDALLRPYLELEKVVQDGVFKAATELYGVTFTERTDLVGYHPDVRVFEVHDGDGTGLGLFLADYYTRESKRGGAWMNNLVDQSFLLDERPVIVNNLNIVKPPAGEPTLLVFDEVITLFHEFGHALHGLFSAVHYPSHSGTEVPRDFVEYPSQVNEMWAWDEEILRSYAVHHQTGEPLPAEWVPAMINSRQFNEGFATSEYLAATLLDQAWHQIGPEAVPTAVEQVLPFEAAALEAAGLALRAVPARYRTTYFNHVFGGGYSAGYYSYIWSEVLDADTVEWFTENAADGRALNRASGDRFRAQLLAVGGSMDSMEAFAQLRGRAPAIEPLLARRGLSTAG
ncbi:peptidyl-dipeptidase Dcp [Sanguibacter gelidistatuariae]|uniref:Peptidyl-dipeptidase Dcp n=2 Tax=Sanguibacter gelidistatuariae TaxID=1814289 RepID=A0A1G6TGJ4_9MICO|nr:M3 family metallopeptidase [Sanguibacter gelidistatuariae]SDD28190.1 peptidyl-dipeptidase Dcp [Sanguibacter gelidistatuariae]